MKFKCELAFVVRNGKFLRLGDEPPPSFLKFPPSLRQLLSTTCDRRTYKNDNKFFHLKLAIYSRYDYGWPYVAIFNLVNIYSIN